MAAQAAGPPRLWRHTAAVLVPVMISLLATAAATMGFVLWSAQGVDKRSLDRQTDLARHVIEQQLARIPHDQESVTVWDDSVVNTSTHLDAGWINTNLGVWMDDFFGHDQVIVVDADNRAVYDMENGAPVGAGNADAELADLAPLLAQLRRQISNGAVEDYYGRKVDHPPHLADLATIAGKPTLVSIAPIVSDTGQLRQPQGREFLHISMVHLSDAYAARLGDEYLIPDLAFTSAGQTDIGRTGIPLTNASGRFVTFMEWAQSSPGQAIVNQTLPAITGAFFVACIIAFMLVDQLWRKSSALEAGRAEAERRASQDPLTGLPNRTSFEANLSRHLAGVVDPDRRTAVLLLDLDRFKQINDTLGHRAGDALIQAVGQRLDELLGDGDRVARIGGDEFGILHSAQITDFEPQRLSRRIIDAVNKPFLIHGSEAFVSVSIGIAIAEGADADAHELARRADIALYEAKARGRSRAVVFEESMNELLQNRQMLEADLRDALRRTDQLSVAFQPLYDRDGTIIGAEALARWHHPRLGQVSPAHFIPVAEASHLIEQLGAFVLREACWSGAGWPGYVFAVNISPAQLRNPAFAGQVFALLRETGMRPTDLELEITEGILLEDATTASETLRLLREAGIRIALDDFGTGYSSLNYLKRYPVDRVKIDRSFVSQLTQGSVSVAIVQAMVTLAHALGIEVTAEGVETREQMNVLRDLGVNVFQGFLLSPPVPSGTLWEELAKAVAASSAPRSQVA